MGFAGLCPGLPWFCQKVLPWFCHGSAMVLPWLRHGPAVVLLGFAMLLLGFAMALLSQDLVGSSQVRGRWGGDAPIDARAICFDHTNQNG